MTFKEKIDKILKFNTLQINSVSGLEDFIKAGRGAVNDFYNRNKEPGRKTLKKILSLPGLSLTWWDTGEGDVFCITSEQILTHEQKDPMITRKPQLWGAEENYRTMKEILEGVRIDLAVVRAERDQIRAERDELKKELEVLRQRTASPDNVKQ